MATWQHTMVDHNLQMMLVRQLDPEAAAQLPAQGRLRPLRFLQSAIDIAAVWPD